MQRNWKKECNKLRGNNEVNECKGNYGIMSSVLAPQNRGLCENERMSKIIDKVKRQQQQQQQITKGSERIMGLNIWTSIRRAGWWSGWCVGSWQ